MVKKTVLKVDINCSKCKKKLIKTVSSLQGIDKIEVDEGKGMLTVTGDADPYEIIVRLRKSGKYAEIVSIGPPHAPPKQEAQKKPEENKKSEEIKKPEENKKREEIKKPEEKKEPGPVYLDQMSYVPYMQMPQYYPPYQQHVAVVHHMNRFDEPDPSCTIM